MNLPRRPSIWLLCLSVIALVHPVAADQTATSLDALVSEALLSNPELRFYRSEIAAASGERITAGAYKNPELGLEIGNKRAEERGGGLIGEGTAWTVSVSQTFDFPGRMGLRKAIANGQIKLAELGFEHFKASLAARVRVLGYTLYVAQEKTRAAKEVSERGSELIKVLVQRDPAGVAPILETRIIEASVITLNRRSTEAAREAQSALFELNQLRGKPVSEPLVIGTVSIGFDVLPTDDELVRKAMAGNFELRMREVELGQQGLRVGLSKNERYPAFTVSPYYSQESAGEKERTVGLGVTVPLPLWDRNTGEVRASTARMDQAQTSLRLAQRQVERSVREQALSYRLRLTEMAHWRPDAVTELRDAAELGDRHYRLGSLPVGTYLTLQEQYLDALEAILSTQVETLESLSGLELLTGMSLHRPSAAAKSERKPNPAEERK